MPALVHNGLFRREKTKPNAPEDGRSAAKTNEIA
jgi:hypothetical protein